VDNINLLYLQSVCFKVTWMPWAKLFIIVATYPSTGGWGEIKRGVIQKGERVGIVTNVYSRKMLEKPKKGLWILKIRVRELFTHRKGISTPRSSQEMTTFNRVCKNVTSILFIFPFYIFKFFCGWQGDCPCPYIS